MTGAMRASASSSSTYQAALPSHQAVEAKTPSRPAPASSPCRDQARPGVHAHKAQSVSRRVAATIARKAPAGRRPRPSRRKAAAPALASRTRCEAHQDAIRSASGRTVTACAMELSRRGSTTSLSISALEQIPGLVGTGPVERQPVEDDVEAKAQATTFAQRGYLMDRLFDRTADPQAGVRLGQIADQQRIVASRQEGTETHMVETQVGGSRQPRLPIAVAVEIVDMANARRPHLQTPTRLSHPGRPGRGLQAPAHS